MAQAPVTQDQLRAATQAATQLFLSLHAAERHLDSARSEQPPANPERLEQLGADVARLTEICDKAQKHESALTVQYISEQRLRDASSTPERNIKYGRRQTD